MDSPIFLIFDSETGNQVEVARSFVEATNIVIYLERTNVRAYYFKRVR